MSSELIAMIEYLEQDKAIPRETLFELVEEAMASVYRKEMPPETKPSVSINRKNGKVTLEIDALVVETVTDPRLQMSLEEAVRLDADCELGDYMRKTLPQEDLSRIAAQNTRQAIMQRLRQYEKDRVVDEYADMIGELVSGKVRGFEKGELIIDFGRAQGGLSNDQRVRRERFEVGDHITALLLSIDPKKAGPSMVVSRTDPQFVAKLFEREVAEISSGIVEIKGVSRRAGSRTKIAVHSTQIDPVGACIGLRGARVRAICQEISNEKLDIVRWSDDLCTYVAEAFKPMPVERVEFDDATNMLHVYVPESSMAQAVGTGGENIRLIEEMVDMDIEIHAVHVQNTERSFEDHHQESHDSLKKLAGVDDELAEALYTAGFTDLEGIAAAAAADLVDAVPVLKKEQAAALVASAQNRLHK